MRMWEEEAQQKSIPNEGTEKWKDLKHVQRMRTCKVASVAKWNGEEGE